MNRQPDTESCTAVDAVFASLVALPLQADHLKHRSQVMNSMQKRDHKQLWSGLNNGNV